MIRQTGNTETLRTFNKALELLQSPAAESEEQLRNMLIKAKQTEERTGDAAGGAGGGLAGFRKGPNPGGLRRGAPRVKLTARLLTGEAHRRTWGLEAAACVCQPRGCMATSDGPMKVLMCWWALAEAGDGAPAAQPQQLQRAKSDESVRPHVARLCARAMCACAMWAVICAVRSRAGGRRTGSSYAHAADRRRLVWGVWGMRTESQGSGGRGCPTAQIQQPQLQDARPDEKEEPDVSIGTLAR